MLKQILRFRIAMALFLILALSSSNAFAWGHGGRRYYYRWGRWHNSSGWFWFDVGISALAIGAIAETLPPRYTTVVVAGVPYYYYDNVYYRSYPYGGYVVVPAPVETAVVVTPAAANVVPTVIQQNVFTVNIPNSRGGYTPVTLRKVKDGFIGPQGELYSEFPSVEQLRLMYGNIKSK